jgi:hypothetical protein
MASLAPLCAPQQTEWEKNRSRTQSNVNSFHHITPDIPSPPKAIPWKIRINNIELFQWKNLLHKL